MCDTNVLVSALLFPGGPCDEILKLVQEGYAKLVISLEICAEFERVLINKFGMPEGEVKEAIKNIKEVAVIVKPHQRVTLIKDDPSDNKILECGLAAEVDYIISGDVKHLQSLKEFQGIAILSPAKFLAFSSY